MVTADAAATVLATTSATATCPAGTVAFSGGVTVDDNALTLVTGIRASAPTVDADGVPNGWTAKVANTAAIGASVPFHVHVICA